MLHEILLSLSGQPSPLFSLQSEEDALPEDAFPLLSPSEKALLVSLARLSRLHARLRANSATILSSHPSVICRAVSSAITTEHLGKFQKKVLEVEQGILVEDSGYVGGYGIVPLSTIVGEFAPWTRRLEWLWELVCFIQPDRGDSSSHACTGAALIDHLRAESQTGYVDIEEIALHLVTAAETAWMRQLSMWLLYGNLPMFGKEDFFIQEDIGCETTRGAVHFALHADLLPKFVSPDTATSILFIGKSLNHIRARGNASTRGPSSGPSTSSVTLHGDHIDLLAALKPPIPTAKLSRAVSAIRLSLSQSTLSKLLPLPKILEVLSLLHDFLLLRRGEFAMALVSHADARLSERHRRPEPKTKASDGLSRLFIKEGDVMATLARSFTELYALQNEDDPVDDELDLARDLLRLSIHDSRSDQPMPVSQDINLATEISNVSYGDLLFPTATSLTLQIRPPLDLFLSSADISIYSKIHSYLLGIRRAQIRLSDLWKHTSLRKSYPSPWGPPRSSTPFGQNKLRMGRERDSIRTRQMRSIWATSSASLFVLSEIGSFFQGEVVNGSWQHFHDWIGGAPSSRASVAGSRPGTASSMKQNGNHNVLSTEKAYGAGYGSSGAPSQHDPETLTVAHRRYLSSLVQSLYLNNVPFTKSLRLLLASVDRFIALVIRLENIQRNMDLEMDEGVVDALVDYPGEEREVWHTLTTTRADVEARIKDVVDRLREIDDSRSEAQRLVDFAKSPNQDWQSAGPVCSYVPRKAAGVDRLLMKLDFGNLNSMPEIAGGFVDMDS